MERDFQFDDFRNLSLWGLKMKVIEMKDRNLILVQQLLDVWESAVKATHLFLSESEIEHIKKLKVSMNTWVSKFTKELQMTNREILILFYI